MLRYGHCGRVKSVEGDSHLGYAIKRRRVNFTAIAGNVKQVGDRGFRKTHRSRD